MHVPTYLNLSTYKVQPLSQSSRDIYRPPPPRSMQQPATNPCRVGMEGRNRKLKAQVGLELKSLLWPLVLALCGVVLFQLTISMAVAGISGGLIDLLSLLDQQLDTCGKSTATCTAPTSTEISTTTVLLSTTIMCPTTVMLPPLTTAFILPPTYCTKTKTTTTTVTMTATATTTIHPPPLPATTTESKTGIDWWAQAFRSVLPGATGILLFALGCWSAREWSRRGEAKEGKEFNRHLELRRKLEELRRQLEELRRQTRAITARQMTTK
ncbi:hypothetical protein DFH27DRAFT_550537 [Peziza echinospora]|nr:hypothetical protein DFH27DRAFT_550537 [Peziza echinospora]